MHGHGGCPSIVMLFRLRRVSDLLYDSKCCLLSHMKDVILHRSIFLKWNKHYIGVIMGAIASQIASLTIVYSIVYSSADQRKLQSSAPLTFVRVIHRRPVNSPHKWPVTRKNFHLMTSSWNTLSSSSGCQPWPDSMLTQFTMKFENG